MKKLISRRGETLVEVLVSLLIAVMIVSMLPMALETAARINAQVEEMETICEHTMAPGTKAIVYAGLYRTTGDKIADFTVQGYSENGFTYYVSK